MGLAKRGPDIGIGANMFDPSGGDNHSELSQEKWSSDASPSAALCMEGDGDVLMCQDPRESGGRFRLCTSLKMARRCRKSRDSAACV